MLNLKKEQIETLHELTAKITEKTDLASEILRTVQDQHGEIDQTFEREGKQVTVKEKVLWQEVFYLYKKDPNCQAAKILKSVHPEVFEAYAEQDKSAMELRDFAIKTFGFDYQMMTLSDHVSLIDAMIDYKLATK